MKVLDITYDLNEGTEVYEGDPHFIKEEVFTIPKDGFALSIIRMGSHLGTHTDAPSHFIDGGKTLQSIPLSSYIGECCVTGMDKLDRLLGPKILLKSTAGRPARLTEQQAVDLVRKGARLVGTDALSIGNDAVHTILLENDCVILEYLKLDSIKPGMYFLCALPMKIDADGAPVRACLIADGYPKG